MHVLMLFEHHHWDAVLTATSKIPSYVSLDLQNAKMPNKCHAVVSFVSVTYKTSEKKLVCC